MLSLSRYRDLPIQRKLSIIVVIGILSAIVVTVANFISFDRDNVKRDLIEEMRVLARITAARSAVAVAFGDRANALENISALALRSTIQYACIYDQQHKLFAQYRRKNSVFSGCDSALLTGHNLVQHDNLLAVVEPIQRKGQRLGDVLVASDLSPIAERTRKWISTSFFVTLAALLVAYLTTRRLQRSVVQPIVDLSHVMDRVRSSNDLSLRARAKGHDEVGALVNSFNDMLRIVENHNRDLEMLYRELVEKSAEAEATAASLEVRNQHIKDVFGSAAHDLRQPLQAMAIFADSLFRKVTDPEQLSTLDKLKKAMENLSGLFNEILDASRYEFDSQAAASQTIGVKDLLSRMFLEFEALAEQKQLKLRFYTPDYKVRVNGALLERIIRNLLSNAIRYTDRGGVLLGCRRRGQYLQIEVWDTGRGIPAKKQADIFSKFVQVDDADRTERGGFGLGLAIVKQFVDNLGYDLSVESVVGRGTVFRLRVPLASDETHASANAAEALLHAPDAPVSTQVASKSGAIHQTRLDSLEPPNETRILLIDDTLEVRQALKMTLENWGFAVDDFVDIESMQAFYYNGGPAPALIISDFQLADNITGDQAIAAARRQLHSDVPAFIVSGAETEALWQSISATGFMALHKPVKPARLRAMINHFLR
ncbi:MAG TPA: ATP-binding protein [Marinagarivorans sp.]